MNLNRVDDFMEEALNDQQQQQNNNNLLNLDRLGDPLLSAVNQSTVDMSNIDPIITNYGLMSMHHNCDNASVDSILQSDSDSLISDIDMVS